MSSAANQPVIDAQAIWTAGVEAVRSDRLVESVIHVSDDRLTICEHDFDLKSLGNIAVVGAGKAGAGMAAAIERAFGDELLSRVSGWVNVPADCVRQLRKIHLHAGRPAGVNEPTEKGVEGAQNILKIVSDLGDDDLCIVLLSGGGSALLPAPRWPFTLADKQAVTRFLMHSGATINELNTVRKRMSAIKGGGLARANRAGHLISLIISDVIGDPLDVIASGPTYLDPSTDADALAVLQQFGADAPDVPQVVLDELARATHKEAKPFPDNVENNIIGNNQVAIEAAVRAAERLGYRVLSLGSDNCGDADEEGRQLAERCVEIRQQRQRNDSPVCILSGGEPTVQLAKTDKPRKGGRNQQLVLAGMQRLWSTGMDGIVLLSGGTDGEDGPTDAAGAWGDAQKLSDANTLGLAPDEFLRINNAYCFFEQLNALLKTGATHTNVMDLRVALIHTT